MSILYCFDVVQLLNVRWCGFLIQLVIGVICHLYLTVLSKRINVYIVLLLTNSIFSWRIFV